MHGCSATSLGAAPPTGLPYRLRLRPETATGVPVGLDVVARQQIRDTIKALHAGDVESLCKRGIIINHGEIIYDDRVSTFKRQYLTDKIVDLRFAERLDEGFKLPGVEVLKVGTYGVKLRFDTRTTPVEQVVGQLMAERTVVDINVADPPMEEIIRRIYAT